MSKKDTNDLRRAIRSLEEDIDRINRDWHRELKRARDILKRIEEENRPRR